MRSEPSTSLKVASRSAVSIMYVRSSVPGSKIAGVPSGASFTGVTSNVIVCVEDKFSPPFAVPPLSCTWKLKLV